MFWNLTIIIERYLLHLTILFFVHVYFLQTYTFWSFNPAPTIIVLAFHLFTHSVTVLLSTLVIVATCVCQTCCVYFSLSVKRSLSKLLLLLLNLTDSSCWKYQFCVWTSVSCETMHNWSKSPRGLLIELKHSIRCIGPMRLWQWFSWIW